MANAISGLFDNKARVLLLLGSIALSGCGNAATEASTAVPRSAGPVEPQNPLEIQATPALMEEIKTGTVGWANVGGSITVSAHVEVDENRVTRVGSPVMGRINTLFVREGEDVKQGQLIAQLKSSGLSDGQLALLKSLSQKQVAQRAVERAKILLDAQVIGSAELQRREAELAQATAELDSARDELALLGMPEEAIVNLEKTRNLNSVARVLATMDGTVLDRKSTIGQMVAPSDTIFEIADLSSVWLVADVPEQVAGNLARGYSVEAEVAAFPGKTLRGRLSFVSSTVNPETRTVRVRMDVPNPDRKLKPSMLATMVLSDQTEKKRVVPSAAVVRQDNLEHLFVQVDDTTFLLREVQLGEEQNGKRVVLDGVRPDERVVMEGAFHLNNERLRVALRGNEGG